MPDSYTVSPTVITLAKCIYHAQAEHFGTLLTVAFDKMTERERAPFIESAARVLIAFNPHPRARVRASKPPKTEPKSPRFEIWSLSQTLARSTFIGERTSIADALALIPWRRRPLRVRTFYDHRRKRRIVQFLSGKGIAVREGSR